MDEMPQEATRCLAFNARVSPAELQTAILGFTYAELSAALVQRWGIPDTIYRPVSLIHDTDSGVMDEDTLILQLSYVLALDNVNPEVFPSYHNLTPELYDRLSFEQQDLEDALDITNLQCISVMSLFNPNSFIVY